MQACRCLAALLAALAAGLVAVGPAKAQQPAAAAHPADIVPEKMRHGTPYGAPISLQKATAAMQAAIAEANRRGWQINVTVVDSGANLVTSARMDGAQLAAIAIAEHKARVAASFRRPTRMFDDAAQKNAALLSLDGVIAARGGIPLIEDGKIIGAIGCAGGTGAQDEVVCTAGADPINK